MKRIVVLGSTGSIGVQTLDVVRAFPGEFEVVGLAAGNNVELLNQQIQEFRPRYACCLAPMDPMPQGVKFLPMTEMVCLSEMDLVMVATTGSVGLIPTLNALKSGKRVALSNKEPIVMAGSIIKDFEGRFGGKVLPVDSEPSAIWQCLRGEENDIRRLLITASGGPFRSTPLEELDQVSPAQALKHPTWQMGQKITIDSATLMNKAFEVIESHWLFGVPWDQIEVVVHPQSTIHSMVEFADGSVKAQMGPPDMRLPIQYALFYPQRLPNDMIPRLDTSITHSLTFQPLEEDRYPCFGLAIEAGRQGGSCPTVLSAADEVAVHAFLDHKIGFTGIPRLVERVLSEHQPGPARDPEELLEVDRWATARAIELVPH
ncbi:MAG: 1-deoxy-D-xylulose-5-phosphate reductoisomerase [SAR202 cluster bacterium Io17-Chloro-G9]|nr:MAG: 1-deoxy-D-xylulose-5-phosphate reductoisomerase [SAR202 cluster bacterium Io17-Chloro-G9]